MRITIFHDHTSPPQKKIWLFCDCRNGLEPHRDLVHCYYGCSARLKHITRTPTRERDGITVAINQQFLQTKAKKTIACGKLEVQITVINQQNHCICSVSNGIRFSTTWSVFSLTDSAFYEVKPATLVVHTHNGEAS